MREMKLIFFLVAAGLTACSRDLSSLNINAAFEETGRPLLDTGVSLKFNNLALADGPLFI